MDSGIVEGFQNLHVLQDSVNVDSLALDFAVALDDSSPRPLRKQSLRGIDGQPNATRHPIRKRRFKKRKSSVPMSVSGSTGGSHIAAVNVSDGVDSSSSDSPARPDFMDTVARLSDSDDMIPNKSVGMGMLRISVPSSVQFAESDSVTENWTPLRPQRRRKHFRRMAIDVPESAMRGRASCIMNGVEQVDVACALLPPRVLDAYRGKRKRGVKEKSDASSFDHDIQDSGSQSNNKITDTMLSSSVSSDESEIDANSNDDAVDGDDEQSDFYCEPDYPSRAGGLMAASMIAGARARWKAEHFPSDPHLARLHHDVCSHMLPSLRNTYKTRCKILFGREFHSGRRRIKDWARPPYSYSCFLQDRHGWTSSSVQRHAFSTRNQPVAGNFSTSTDGGGGKRHRMMGTSEEFTDLVDKHVLTTSSEMPLEGRLRLTSVRAPAGSFVSDGSAASLSKSSAEVRQ